MSDGPPRVLIWVTHVLGIGHFRRVSAVADALAVAGASPLIVSGGMPVAGSTGKAMIEQLPGIRSSDEGYTNLVDENGEPASEGLFLRRTDKLLRVFNKFRPALVVTELFPFGRRLFAGEVDALLDRAEGQAKIVCSIRDIVQPLSRPEKLDDIRRRVRSSYDGILVHGDPDLVDVEQALPVMAEFADLIRYTGYVCQPAQAEWESEDGDGEVIVSAGGGAVGRELLFAAARARGHTTARNTVWRFLVGPHMAIEDIAALKSLAGPNSIVEAVRQDFPALLKRARLSICQAGYNTCTDVFAARVPAVFVPFAGQGEIEQPMRAQLLEAGGFGVTVQAAELTPERLAAAVDRALLLDLACVRQPSLDGAAQSARIIMDMLGRPIS